MTAVLNASNEQAVALFLDEKISYLDIPKVIEQVCDRHRDDLTAHPSLEDIVRVDQWARTATLAASQSLNSPAVVSLG